MSRILYVEANEDGTVGGSHKILFDLVTRLSPQNEPVVLFYQENIWARRLRDAGVEVITWDDVRQEERRGFQQGGRLSTAWVLAGGVRRRRRLIGQLDIDLVHLNNSPYIGYDDWLPASRLAGVPCVVYGMGDLRQERNPVRRRIVRTYDAYFPLSRLMQKAYEGNGMPPGKMVLTYPGVDLAEVDGRDYRDRDDVRGEFDLDPDQLLVVMIGNIRPWKGQHVVVEALSGLTPAERRRIKVLMVGQEDESNRDFKQTLDASILEAGLEDVVHFTGRREDVPDLLEAAEIAIHASVAPEPFGLVVQEAMLHGCATVAADEGGPVEMMTPESGRMFDTDHPEELTRHLRDFLDDPAGREALSLAAREQARTFDVRRHVELVEATYRDLLSD